MNKDNLIKQTIKDIDRLSKILRESYVYEDDDVYDESSYDEELDNEIPQVNDKLGEIRQLALSGIQDYAQNVDDPNYEVFKKIWMLCDKACSNKDKVSE